jgi:hypothetical protein
MKRKIYIYTTKIYGRLGWFKIGETHQLVKDRVKRQDGTSNPEPLDVIYEVESILSDKEIHKILESKGYERTRNDADREWFIINDGDNPELYVEQVINLINVIISESKLDTREEYIPRFYQTYIKEKTLNKLGLEIKAGYSKIDFASELGPRFGKTISAIDMLPEFKEKYGFKVCVLPSYVLSSLSSFEKELNKFKGYSDDIIYTTINDDIESIITENYGKKMVVIEVSLHINEYQKKLEFIRNLPLKDKISIIDEADFGAHRFNSQEVIDYIDSYVNFYMTGTGIEKVISSLDNVRDNIIRFSYADMLMIKNGEHPIQKDMDVITLKESMNSVKDIVIPQFVRLSLGGIIQRFNNIPEEYRTDWNKLFLDVDKSKNILSNLVKSLFGVYNGNATYLVDLDTGELSPKNVTMIFANTPDKKQQTKFFNLLKETLGPQYIVMLINGDETSNRKAEVMAKKTIALAKRQNKKVVFLSKDMGSRSFSVSEIDTIMLMFDRGAYSTISQKISRGLTPGLTYLGGKKTHSTIISLSLDANRDEINPIDEYLVYEGEKVDNNELGEGIKRVLRSVNVFVNEDGILEPIVIDEYANKLINSSSLIRLGIETINLKNVLSNNELIKLLTNIDIKGRLECIEKIEGVDSSTIERIKDTKTKKEKDSTKLVEDLRKKLKQVLSNIIEKIVEISEINNCESNDIITTIDMIKEKGYENELIFDIDINCETFKQLITTNVLSHKLLNTIITSYNKGNLDNVFYGKIDKYLKWKSNPSKSEVFTSIEVVNEILDEIPERVWKNSKSIFLDPCMGKGTFLIEVVKRLVYIYGYTEQDAKSRVYGYDIRVKYVNHLTRRGFLNVRHKDYINEKIEMKFDSIVGNPPYQNNESDSDAGKLYIDITKKSLNLLKENGIISFLTPETIVRDGRNKFNIKDIQGLKYINHTVDKYFNVGVKIINWMVDKNYDGDVTVINTDGEVNLRSKTQSLLDKSELLGVGIFEKLKEQKSKLFIIDQSGKKWSKTYSEGMYRVNKNVNKHKVEYTSVKPKLFEKRKLVISMSSSYKEELVYDSYEDFGELHVMIDITDYNDVEINNIKNFLFNPICVNICNKYKKLYKKGFNTMLYLFPKIDVSKEYGDEDVKLLFNLTDDDVKYLLS